MKKLFLVLFLFSLNTIASDRLEIELGEPDLSSESIEEVAAMPYPPGNVGVAADGRVFFSYFTEVGLKENIALWLPKEKKAQVLFRDGFNYQGKRHQLITVLGLHIDYFNNWLWVLDHADHGTKGKAKLVAFDLNHADVEKMPVVHFYEFPKEVAGKWSMLNDFTFDYENQRIYLSNTAIMAQMKSSLKMKVPGLGSLLAKTIKVQPSIVVYDYKTESSFEILKGHPSVVNGPYAVHTNGKKVKILGIVTPKFGVDGIVYDEKRRILYYSSLNGGELFAIHNPGKIEKGSTISVRKVADISMSDGMMVDEAGRVYLTDMENSAINYVTPEGQMSTLVKAGNKKQLRWPDGLSFGPKGDIYVSCSSLQDVFPNHKNKRAIKKKGPYYIYKIKTNR